MGCRVKRLGPRALSAAEDAREAAPSPARPPQSPRDARPIPAGPLRPSTPPRGPRARLQVLASALFHTFPGDLLGGQAMKARGVQGVGVPPKEEPSQFIYVKTPGQVQTA